LAAPVLTRREMNLTWSRRWRLHETPRRRRRGRQSAHAPRERVAVVSRRCRSHTGFNFNFQSSGFGQRPRAPPRRRPPPPRQPPPLPPQVVKAQRLVGRISSLSRLRKAALNPDTGTASKHVFHAFYTAGSCEDRLDRELRFPYPLVDLDDSKHVPTASRRLPVDGVEGSSRRRRRDAIAATPSFVRRRRRVDTSSHTQGDRRWDAHVRYFKTDISPGKPSSDDALKLAKKLGAENAASDANQCPTFVSIKRGAGLRAKDVTAHFFRRRSQNAFETWATSQLKVDVTFRSNVKADVVLYWHDPHDDGYGKLIAKLRPGGEFRSGTFPTHRFSFCLATAHERIDERDKASGDRVALPEGIIVKSHVVTSERDVTVTASAPSSVLDGHVSCRRSPCRTSADKARCPRQCPGRASRWGRASSRPSEEDLFSRGREL
jgi:hypothetical protein